MDPVKVKAVLTSLLEVLRTKGKSAPALWERVAIDLAVNGLEYEVNNTAIVDEVLSLLKLRGEA